MTTRMVPWDRSRSPTVKVPGTGGGELKIPVPPRTVPPMEPRTGPLIVPVPTKSPATTTGPGPRPSYCTVETVVVPLFVLTEVGATVGPDKYRSCGPPVSPTPEVIVRKPAILPLPVRVSGPVSRGR